jgi:hypothetical protein
MLSVGARIVIFTPLLVVLELSYGSYYKKDISKKKYYSRCLRLVRSIDLYSQLQKSLAIWYRENSY